MFAPRVLWSEIAVRSKGAGWFCPRWRQDSTIAWPSGRMGSFGDGEITFAARSAMAEER